VITFNRALARKLVRTVSREDETGTFQIRVGTISTVVTITVSAVDDGFEPTSDHAIKTDLQAGPYRVRPKKYAVPGEALDAALETFCFYYSLARRHGFEPQSSWLVPT